jgi:hypothetical protein
MLTAQRRRTTWAVTASIIAHLAAVVFVVLQKPILRMPVDEGGPPPPVIPVLIVPRTQNLPAGAEARPAPIRLHRRPQRFVPPEAPTAPIAPPAPLTPPGPARPRGPVAVHPSPLPEGPKGDVRTALRQGPVGCANTLAVGLNHAERDLCDETLGKGAKDAPFIDPGVALSRDKRTLLDTAATKRDADRKYRDGQAPPGVSDALGGADQPSKVRGLPY